MELWETLLCKFYIYMPSFMFFLKRPNNLDKVYQQSNVFGSYFEMDTGFLAGNHYLFINIQIHKKTLLSL